MTGKTEPMSTHLDAWFKAADKQGGFELAKAHAARALAEAYMLADDANRARFLRAVAVKTAHYLRHVVGWSEDATETTVRQILMSASQITER